MIKYTLVIKMKSLHIILNNTKNTRSLSTLINREGRHIKPHALIRSDALNKLDKKDIDKLCDDYKLKRVIDLRCLNEIQNNPDVQMNGVEHISNPILPNERVGVTKKGNPEEDFIDFIEAIQTNGAQSSEEFMKKVYKEIVESEFSNQAYSKFLNILLEEVPGATLWHCSAGKDRAGFATILVLYLLDFSIEDILNDYLATNQYYQSSIDEFLCKFGEEYKETLETVFGVSILYMDVLFANINALYGSIDQYIEHVLGFSKEKKEALKRIYLEE